jgi:hypothetical protein
MRIVAEPFEGSTYMYFGTITELLLQEEIEYVSVRWAASQKTDMIPCLRISSYWNKDAKVGELSDCGHYQLPSTPNEWFDFW